LNTEKKKVQALAKQRDAFLLEVYRRSDIDPKKEIPYYEIAKSLGFEKDVLERASRYLIGEGLIKNVSINDTHVEAEGAEGAESFTVVSSEREGITITHKGIVRAEKLDDGTQLSDINLKLIEETRHWLDLFPDALALYNGALQKHGYGVFKRNVLDDLRLSLEKLLQSLFSNKKTLENQISNLGTFVKKCGGSTEFSNMFLKLIDYYTKYQNTYVKHDDAVVEEEVEFVFEITSSFMKHIVRLYHAKTIP